MQEGSAAPGPLVSVIGLGRQIRTSQDAFHRIDPSLAVRVGKIAFTVRVRGLAPHPVACREPRPASSKADWSLQAIPSRALRVVTAPRREARGALRRRTCGEKDASLRLLQPTYDHVHPARTIQFPSAPAAAYPLAGRPLRDPLAGVLAGPNPLRGWRGNRHRPPSILGPPADPRVERRLTATLQLQPSHTTCSQRVSGNPDARFEEGTTRSWRGCDRQLLRAMPPGRGFVGREPRS